MKGGEEDGEGEVKKESGDCTSLLRFVTDRNALDTLGLHIKSEVLFPKHEGTADLPVPLGIKLSKKKKKGGRE